MDYTSPKFLGESKKRYEISREQVREYTMRNNELLLTLSRCQIDLMDLRKFTKLKNAAILQVTQKIEIMTTSKKQEPPAKEEVKAAAEEDDDEELNDMIRKIHQLDASINNASSQLVKINAENTERVSLTKNSKIFSIQNF